MDVNIGTVSNSNGILTINFNSNASQARVDEVLSSLTYSNASNIPPASVQIDWTFNDGNTGAQGTGDELMALGSTTVNITPTNDAPTLTAFTSTVASGNEDSQIPVIFANLLAQGNEADVDGTVAAFVVKAISSGTLKIGASAGTATAWNAITNNIIDATYQAYWTPGANTNGSPKAFTVVVKDNDSAVSATAIQAKVLVKAINDAPVLTTPTAINYIDTAYDDAFPPVTGTLVASDIDGNALTYGITGGTDYGLTISKNSTYGELMVTKATGAYSFVAYDDTIEPLTVAASASFTLSKWNKITLSNDGYGEIV